MKIPAIAAALICTCLLTVGRAADRITGPWDVPALTKDAPKAEWGERKGLVQPVYYEGVPFQGKPTRVFAYCGRPAEGVALPEGASQADHELDLPVDE